MKGGLRITGALSQRYVQITIIVIIARALTATSKVHKNPTYSLFKKTRIAFYRLKKKEQGRLALLKGLKSATGIRSRVKAVWPCAERHDVESWLNAQSFSLKTRANYLRDLGILFNFALSRRWTAENPCAFIEKPSELDREVSALTPEEASKLLASCPDAFLPGVCLKLFAGYARRNFSPWTGARFQPRRLSSEKQRRRRVREG